MHKLILFIIATIGFTGSVSAKDVNAFRIEIKFADRSGQVKSSSLIFDGRTCEGTNGNLKRKHAVSVCTQLEQKYYSVIESTGQIDSASGFHERRLNVEIQTKRGKLSAGFPMFAVTACDENHLHCESSEPLPVRDLAIEVLSINR